MTCKNTHHSLNALNAEAKKSIDVCSFMIAAYQVNICGILNLPRKYKDSGTEGTNIISQLLY
jgi:hypothetical protein